MRTPRDDASRVARDAGCFMVRFSPAVGYQIAAFGAPRSAKNPSSALRDIGVQQTLDVEDRRAIHRFEAAHAHATAVDAGNGDLMQPDRIRPVRGPRGEDAGHRSRPIAARVVDDDVAVGAIEPGEDDDLVAGLEPREPGGEFRRRSPARPRARLRPACFGAPAGSCNGDSTLPMGRSVIVVATPYDRAIASDDRPSRPR